MALERLKLINRRMLASMILLIVVSATGTAAAAQSHGPATINASTGALKNQGEYGLPQKDVEIGRVFGFPIPNSMLVSLNGALGLTTCTQLATRKMAQVP